jgi:UDP-N-acetylglucosamine 1-carboxyvinyltransferase
LDKFVIKGGNRLNGRVEISGAKNAALAIIPACLLNNGVNTLSNVPEVNDCFTMSKLLKHLGADIQFENNQMTINTADIKSQDAPYEHVKKMRASVYVLGPLLARYGCARVSMPGGCAWGPRPINLHLEAMKKLGAEIELEGGYIIAKGKKLKGAKLNFDISSVGATGNALMAAVLARGSTVISNAAIEPEITALAGFLNNMGAKISGLGTTTLEIEGVDELKSTEVEVIQDRIEAGTILIAGAMTGGKIEIVFKNPNHISSVISKLEDSGAEVIINDDIIGLDASDLNAEPVDVSTAIYPGFPTDMQAQWTAYMSIASGTATVTDSIYLDRFKHIPELIRLGADIEMIRNSAVIKGVKNLKGAKVMSTDLRASASLVLGGLAAQGVTEVLRIYHLDRGYERIEQKLKLLGAEIERIETKEF